MQEWKRGSSHGEGTYTCDIAPFDNEKRQRQETYEWRFIMGNR